MRRCARAVPGRAGQLPDLLWPHGRKWGESLKTWRNLVQASVLQSAYAGRTGVGYRPSPGFHHHSGHFIFPAPRGLFLIFHEKLERGFARRSGPGACPLPAGGRWSAGRSLPSKSRAPGLSTRFSTSQCQKHRGESTVRRSLGLCVGLYAHTRCLRDGK